MTTFQPKFLTKSVITDVSQITDSAATNAQNRYKLMNRNGEVPYLSIGASSGTRTITWTPTSATSINRIYIQSNNFDTFTIKYNGSSTFSTPITFTGNTATDLYFEFNAVSVTSVTISVSVTMTASALLSLGEWYIGTELFEMSSPGGAPLMATPRVQQQIIALSDGSAYRNYVRSLSDFQLQLNCVTATERLNYVSLQKRARRETIVFIPFPATSTDSWDGVAGHFIWANAADFNNFTGGVQIDGYDVNLVLMQAGGVG